MSDRQLYFVAGHYIGSQKLTLDITNRIRSYAKKLNRIFVVLHYHLGIWQQNPKHTFIVDGKNWSNDWNVVTEHEDWFWHNKNGERVYSKIDGKYLMNISKEGFRDYWKMSILKQVLSGGYNGVFLDSSNIGLLQWEASHKDPRLSGKRVSYVKFQQLGGKSWKEAYEDFMVDITQYLEMHGYIAVPNITGLFTTWDNTNYYTTASGGFMEGAFDTKDTKDWKVAMERAIMLIQRDKIIIFQSYLNRHQDIAKRMYYLSCYLLIKGNYSYLMYFHKKTLSWYPEFEIDIGCPKKTIISSMKEIIVSDGVFKRDYENGQVWVNVSNRPYKIKFDSKVRHVLPVGGGPVDTTGNFNGYLKFKDIKEISIKPWSGMVFLYN